MNKKWLVLRYEVIHTLSRRSFLFTVFGIPILWVVILLAFSLFKGDGPGGPGGGTGSSKKSDELKVEGYVDLSGVVKTIHEDVPDGILRPYPDQATAHQALRNDEINAYYLIPEDYLQTGELLYINPTYSWTQGSGQTWIMQRTLTANLLGNDPERLERFRHPMKLEWTSLTPKPKETDKKQKVPFAIPYATSMVTVIVVLMASGLLLHSIAAEKKNRVMEVLMVSITPREMLSGKIIGLGMLGLLQAIVWIGTAYGLLSLGRSSLNLPFSFAVHPSMLIWGIIFFLLGYVVYSSLMAALGAVVQDVKEASQATIVVIWPMVLTMVLISVIIEHPHGVLATILSLFPLTAPVAMMTRLASGGVPFWQPPLAALLVALTAWFIVRAVASMFRAQLLLSGQPFSLKRFLTALLSRT